VPCKKHGVGSSFLAPFAFEEGLGACAGFPELQVIFTRPYTNFETMDFGDLRLRLWPLPRSNVAGWQLHRSPPIVFYAYTHFSFSILFLGIADFFVLLVLRFPTDTRPSTFRIRLGARVYGSIFVPLQRRTFALFQSHFFRQFVVAAVFLDVLHHVLAFLFLHHFRIRRFRVGVPLSSRGHHPGGKQVCERCA